MSRGGGTGTGWAAVRQSCGSHCPFPSPLLLSSSHLSLHAILQPMLLQRCQLEPISAGAACQPGQQRGCSGKMRFAAVHVRPLREGLSCHLPTLFPLINIQDNYVFVKKIFHWARNIHNRAEMKRVLISSSPTRPGSEGFPHALPGKLMDEPVKRPARRNSSNQGRKGPVSPRGSLPSPSPGPNEPCNTKQDVAATSEVFLAPQDKPL